MTHAFADPLPKRNTYSFWPVVALTAGVNLVIILTRLADIWIVSIISFAYSAAFIGAWIWLHWHVKNQYVNRGHSCAKLFVKHPQPMWIYDLKSLRFLAVNEAAVLLYGYTAHEFLNMTIKDIRPDNDVPALIAATEKIKLDFNLDYHWSGVWRHKRKDGGIRYMEISSREIIYERKKAELVFIYDVTDKIVQEIKVQTLNRDLEKKVIKRTEDLLHLNQKLVNQNKIIKNANFELYTMANQLKEANEKIQHHAELKSKFVSMASHEFRNPLSTIKYSAEVLKRRLSNATKQEMVHRIENIERQVLHMTSVLDDVLTIGKTEAHKMPVTVTAVNVRQFAARMASDVQCASDNGSHQIVLTIDDNVPDQIRSDEKFMCNIFVNLLTNAIKYSPDSDKVFFRVGYNGYSTFWEVQDQGVGICPTEIAKIFEPFYRISSTSAVPGTGLGLAIVKKAVDLIGGKLEIKSDVNKGSRFTVVIPDLLS